MELQKLLDAARAGDRAAWNQLLTHLRPWLRAVLRPWVNQDADASDLTNEAQFRMDRGFGQFRGETTGQFRAWAGLIALNLVREKHRCARPALAPLPETVAAPAPIPPGFDADDMTRLLLALGKLDSRYRTVIEGRLFDGLSCVEIAQRMGELPGTVRMWCYRAVNELKQHLGARP
jgi:RNA polymerase sigma-70 factor (ECF subfamily)